MIYMALTLHSAELAEMTEDARLAVEIDGVWLELRIPELVRADGPSQLPSAVSCAKSTLDETTFIVLKIDGDVTNANYTLGHEGKRNVGWCSEPMYTTAETPNLGEIVVRDLCIAL
jgi:hypothetical protein